MSPTRISLSVALLCGALTACGGGSSAVESAQTASLQVPAVQPAATVAAVVAAPAFHLAPTTLAEPDDGDRFDNEASARRRPASNWLSGDQAALPTRGLTVQTIQDNERRRIQSGSSAAPQASATAVLTYTPAQIRAAYGMPALTAAGVTPTADQAAQQGAGQTIYIVDANHDPNVAAELSAFNQKFGLPTCTSQSVATSATLPLAAASTSAGCTFSVVYATAAGGMSTSVPAYDAGWATEIALDVQWAHATAPRARIVLIEVPDTTTTSLMGGVKLANAMGPGVVSMSFGAPEGSWMTSLNSTFNGTGMSYVAATGDSGAGVLWPSVAPTVLAVGGTTLSWNGSGTRSETVWASTGGGMSAYVARPSYQVNTVPGMGSPAQRMVADVSFNADPTTGQYTAIQPQGGSLSWVSAGGTSLATPQWAGLIAIANAQRARAGTAALGAPHGALYTTIASVPGNYAAALADVHSGSDGSCVSCSAHTGYDAPSGLGTPNTTSLSNLLAGASASTGSSSTGTSAPPTSAAPQISATAWSATVGKAFAGSFTVSDPGGLAMTIQISGIPSGMTMSLSGSTVTAKWAVPLVGSYNIQIKATDSAGLSSMATLPLTVH